MIPAVSAWVLIKCVCMSVSWLKRFGSRGEVPGPRSSAFSFNPHNAQSGESQTSVRFPVSFAKVRGLSKNGVFFTGFHDVTWAVH
jgi:hypothetical protein